MVRGRDEQKISDGGISGTREYEDEDEDDEEAQEEEEEEDEEEIQPASYIPKSGTGKRSARRRLVYRGAMQRKAAGGGDGRERG